MSKIISANKLNRFWMNGVKPTVEKVKNTIKNRTELMNNNEEGKLADALAVKDAINYMTSSMSNIVSENNLSSLPIKTDLMDVDLNDPLAAKNGVHKIFTNDASTLTNSPVNSLEFFGKWECIFHTTAGSGTTKGRLMIKITEFYPKQGRVWVNHYNWTGWSGWFSDYNRMETIINECYTVTNNLNDAPLKTNLLLVHLTDPHSTQNKRHKIFVTNTSELQSCPISNDKGFVGKWEYIYLEANRGMVKITEIYPTPGRVWSNYYNVSTDWGGWKSEYNQIAQLDSELDTVTNNLSSAPLKTKLLEIDRANPHASVNKVHKFSTNDASTLTSSPVSTGPFIGTWECIFHTLNTEDYTNSRIMVKITEFYPVCGRVWYNHYNSTSAWGGWFSDNSLANGNISNTPMKTDMLDIDLTDPGSYKNRKSRISVGDVSTLTNSPFPSGAFYGTWECEFHTLHTDKTKARVMVKVTEYYPTLGRVWYNHYNWSKWTGWRNDGTGTMVDSASTIKANTTGSRVAGALGVKELYNELKAQFIPSDMKIEADTVTTSGETRTITLKGNYTKMLYFNIGNNANPAFPVFLPVGVTFTAPNKVTFKLKVYGNNGVDNSTTGYATGYVFMGQ